MTSSRFYKIWRIPTEVLLHMDSNIRVRMHADHVDASKFRQVPSTSQVHDLQRYTCIIQLIKAPLKQRASINYVPDIALSYIVEKYFVHN